MYRKVELRLYEWAFYCLVDGKINATWPIVDDRHRLNIRAIPLACAAVPGTRFSGPAAFAVSSADYRVFVFTVTSDRLLDALWVVHDKAFYYSVEEVS